MGSYGSEYVLSKAYVRLQKVNDIVCNSVVDWAREEFLATSNPSPEGF